VAHLKWFLIAFAALATAIILVTAAWWISSNIERGQTQAEIDPFYTPPDPLPTIPGEVIRIEPLDVDVAGGSAFRMLYISQRPDGTPAASGAMVFLPDLPAPPDGRPVVAWAHGTVGMGDACAPSRSTNPLADTDGWLEQMLALGWVVTATDYVGLGTPGPELYLVKEAEVRDVVNSVRAVSNLPEARAGNRYVVWGHSQGGHSSLWSGHLAAELAPELELLGVAAAAPAAELTDIMGAQWNTTIGWGIGPEVLISWPWVDSRLSADQVATTAGLRTYEQIANDCTYDKQLLLEILALRSAGQEFFRVDPITVKEWADFARAQIPPPLPPDMPVFLAQGTADEVVLAWPNAKLQEQWCAAGSTITALWMGGVGHLAAATTAGPSAVAWIADRFAGRPAGRTCDIPPPVSPKPPQQAPTP
jgi:alpha-beta hydrolase superfamily lysophospholipase